MNRSRLSPYVPDRLEADQREVYDRIVSGPRASGPQDFPLRNTDGSLTGPFNALVAAGQLGGAVQAVGAALRYHGNLSDLERELAILVVGRYCDAEFEFYAHERVARRIGLHDDVVDALARRETPSLTDDRQQVVYDVAIRLLHTRGLDDELHARANKLLGERDLVELVLLVGYDVMLAQVLNAFEIGLPDDEVPPFETATSRS